MQLLQAAGLVLFFQEGTPLGPGEYRQKLSEIRLAIEAGDLKAAQKEARSLRGGEIRHAGQKARTDEELLDEVERAPGPKEARLLLPRLESLIEFLGALDSAAPSPEAPDPALLERLRRNQAERLARRGGELGARPEIDLPPTLAERLQAAWEWIAEKVGRFLGWLFDLLFGVGRSSGLPQDKMPLMVGILVILVAGGLGAVALLALRRRGAAGGKEAVSEAPPMTAKDQDPLSRTAQEWERLAGELAGAGRFRESMRAWYHALLVTLFRAGVLHYRKDRTNWEYAHSLSPELAWRPGFLEATRGFERVWYGRRDAPAETAQSYGREAQSILDRVRGGGAR